MAIDYLKKAAMTAQSDASDVHDKVRGILDDIERGGDDAARCRLVDALALFGIGYSWGGFESLALPFDVEPVRSEMAWPKEGWGLEDRYAIRLSIGLEDKGDLIADLAAGFAAMNEG